MPIPVVARRKTTGQELGSQEEREQACSLSDGGGGMSDTGVTKRNRLGLGSQITSGVDPPSLQ